MWKVLITLFAAIAICGGAVILFGVRVEEALRKPTVDMIGRRIQSISGADESSGGGSGAESAGASSMVVYAPEHKIHSLLRVPRSAVANGGGGGARTTIRIETDSGASAPPPTASSVPLSSRPSSDSEVQNSAKSGHTARPGKSDYDMDDGKSSYHFVNRINSKTGKADTSGVEGLLDEHGEDAAHSPGHEHNPEKSAVHVHSTFDAPVRGPVGTPLSADGLTPTRKCKVMAERFGVEITPFDDLQHFYPPAFAADATAKRQWDELLCDHRLSPAPEGVIPFACAEIGREKKVRPGVTWGLLDGDPKLQAKWSSMNCDVHLRAADDRDAELSADELTAVRAEAHLLVAKLYDGNGPTSATLGYKAFTRPRTPQSEADVQALSVANLRRFRALPRSSQIDLCRVWKRRYGVVPSMTFGTMPVQLRDSWAGLRCDDCHLHYSLPDEGPGPFTRTGTEPKIAVCCGTTTRNLKNIANYHFEDLALFTTLFRSINYTAERGYEYRIYVAYDAGDAFYDAPGRAQAAVKWYDENVGSVLLATRGIASSLQMVRFDNVLRKPGPAFNFVLQKAYAEGADWFYRVNDDTELCTVWTTPFIRKLTELGPPYGAVGPVCGQGNSNIMTHDFTHRMHMDIFAPHYYAESLVDWWMDDWISKVYGRRRSWQLPTVSVTHHTGKHGRRYDVNTANEAKLRPELNAGKQRILKFMRSKPDLFSSSVISEFDNDQFDRMSYGLFD